MENSPTAQDSTSTQNKKRHTLIIAEAGINMCGSLFKAKKMCDIAAKSGADIFKMQRYDPVKLLGKDSPYLRDAQAGQFTEREYGEMRWYAHKKGLEFLVSLFHAEHVEWGEKMQFKRYKVASRSVKDLELLNQIAKTKKPVIMSVGMSDNGEIEKALNILASNEVTLLYCVCSYPTKREQFDFNNLLKLWVRFRKPVGFSSHCPEIWPSIKAAGLGASVLENHFTISRKLPGCDQSSSLEPHELRKMCEIVRKLDKVP